MNQVTIVTVTRRSGSDAKNYGLYNMKAERFVPFVGRISWNHGSCNSAAEVLEYCADVEADEVIAA